MSVKQNKINKAVILTAGAGKRMLPLTAFIPKALLPLGKRPALQVVTEEAIGAGLNQICFVVDESSVVQKLITYLKQTSPLFDRTEFCFVTQSKPMGSGDALSKAKDFCGGDPFVMLNCDDLFSGNACHTLVSAFDGASVLGVKSIKRQKSVKYGVVTFFNDKRIKGILEKPDLKQVSLHPYILVGRYLFVADIFDYLTKIKPVMSEYRLTDAINLLTAETDVCAVCLKEKRFDAGNFEGYYEAFSYFAKKG
jgi:UTP-glucose-1-phosphate uridylyltransferase